MVPEVKDLFLYQTKVSSTNSPELLPCTTVPVEVVEGVWCNLVPGWEAKNRKICIELRPLWDEGEAAFARRSGEPSAQIPVVLRCRRLGILTDWSDLPGRGGAQDPLGRERGERAGAVGRWLDLGQIAKQQDQLSSFRI